MGARARRAAWASATGATVASAAALAGVRGPRACEVARHVHRFVVARRRRDVAARRRAQRVVGADSRHIAPGGVAWRALRARRALGSVQLAKVSGRFLASHI